MATTSQAVEIETLNPSEGRALFDAAARRWLDMSGEEFVSTWDAGGFNGESDRPEVLRVALLLPFWRG